MFTKQQSLACAASILVAIQNAYCYTTSDLNALKAKLLEGYNSKTNPTLHGEDTNVTVWVRIVTIGGLNEKLQKLTTFLELQIVWYDFAFVWNVTETNIKSLTMDKSEVWVPEFYIANPHFDIAYWIERKNYRPVWYSGYSGNAGFIQMITAETRCSLQTSDFPFDHHVCTIMIYPNQMNLRVRPLMKDVSDILEPGDTWDITSASLEDNNDYTLNLRIVLERRPAFVLVNVIMPMTMLAFLTPLVFLLPNQSGERIGFSVTILLAISVFMAIVSEHVPPKSSPIPLTLIMLFAFYMLTGLVILVVIINARVYSLPDDIPIPRALVYLLKIIRFVCCCFSRRHGKITTESFEAPEALNETGEQDAIRQAITWNDVGWSIDMIFMIVIYTLKIVLVCVFMVAMRA